MSKTNLRFPYVFGQNTYMIFCVGDECVVYQMRITDSKEEAHQLLEKYMWKDPQLIARLMEKQDKIQTKLLQMLSKEIVKESLD